ncbi:sensor histidine kinase [Aquiflexum lacus]|uniref:sensor histidine kinase n=1 Tax=Aquiflexum lacus TaxID=2483805 RepID=UPI00189546B8|nr:ATP-binding protein [Aquiflexum lacus]
MDTIKEHKIMFSCNHHGTIVQVFLDTAGILENFDLPIGIHQIIEKSSINVLGDFWLSIKQNMMEEEHYLVGLNNQGENIIFNFSGYLLNDKVLICGRTDMNSSEKALEEIMLINNEQANKIRLVEKKADNFERKVNKYEVDEFLLNDFSSLNNELINSKREMMRKNQKIELLNNELNTVNKNLELLAYSLSHDLREPLRMVGSFLGLLQRKYVDHLDVKGQRYLKFASEGAKRLSKMLTGLLEYHKAGNIVIDETVDLNNVLSEVKQILQTVIKESKTEIISVKLPIVKGSFTGYQQVFQNLISNSIKFVPKGRTSKISIEVSENDQLFTLAIQDNGIGIPEKKYQEVFVMFKQLHNSGEYEGTGMGLSMVKKTVERMNGKIWVTSEKDKGSTFFIEIKKQK